MVATKGTAIPGCFEFSPPHSADVRGSFVKPFVASALAGHFPGSVAEIFWSVSGRGVVRGMHFQTPPYDHDKVVMCLQGSIHDVVLDIRPGPTYGRVATFTLSGDPPGMLIIPKGCAHGFQSLEDGSIVAYATNQEYAPDHDTGILYSSVGITWPLPVTHVSRRDAEFPPLPMFTSPFGIVPEV